MRGQRPEAPEGSDPRRRGSGPSSSPPTPDAEPIAEEICQESHLIRRRVRGLSVDAPKDHLADRPGDGHRDALGISGADLSALRSGFEHRDELGDVASPVRHPTAPRLFGAVHHRKVQPEEILVLVEVADLRRQHPFQYVPYQAAGFDRLESPIQKVVDGDLGRLLDDLFTRPEIEIDGSFRDAGLVRDLLHGRMREALPANDAHRRLANRAAPEFSDDLPFGDRLAHSTDYSVSI